LRRERPGTEVAVADSLPILGWPVGDAIMNGSPFHSGWGNLLFEAEYYAITSFPPTRWLARALLNGLAGGRLRRSMAAAAPDLIVSTFPAVTDALGELKRRGRLTVPLISAITDLAALRYWAHPAVDVHLIIHPESEPEVRRIAPRSEIVAVTGLYSDEFLAPRDRLRARRELGLPEDPRIVLVSGGGWGVGDLAGAVEVALELGNTYAVVLCGRNEDVRAAMQARFGADERVRVEGFTTRMSDFMAAGDALVHSTAGLTVLEAIVRGCAPVSYGWGRAHIRVNNREYVRHGLARVASTPDDLRHELATALAQRPEPDLSFAELPSAASVVLGAADAA
jgi:UDP-N-acetylglucosamine:LPS N-acetylglucosamine transferase